MGLRNKKRAHTELINPDYDIRDRMTKQRPKVPETVEDATQKASGKKRRVRSGQKRIILELRMPKFRVPRRVKRYYLVSKNWLYKQRFFATKKNRIITLSAVGGCLVLIALIGLIFASGKSKPSIVSTQDKSKPKPTFKYLVPVAEGNNSEPAFNTEKKVIKLTDKFAGVNIALSEQQLDDKAAASPALLENAANNLAATFKFNLADRQIVKTSKGNFYYFNRDKDGEQFGVFQFNKLLILVRTDKMLKADDWKDYIDSLVVSP